MIHVELTWWLAFLWGVFGQAIRALIGIKKQIDDANMSKRKIKHWFNLNLLIVSLILGGIAGMVGLMLLNILNLEIYIVTIMAAGYAGADFIEGVFRKQLQRFGLK